MLAQSGLDENTGETWLALVFIVIAGPFLSHATIRAARIREKGNWRGRTHPWRWTLNGTPVVAVVTPYTTATGLMDALQVTILVLVALGATAVVLTRAPVRQVIVLSVYGILLAVLFLAFQAPDVTLSELTVGAVALPILLLLTLAKVGGRQK